jgi:hypothetical protein
MMMMMMSMMSMMSAVPLLNKLLNSLRLPMTTTTSHTNTAAVSRMRRLIDSTATFRNGYSTMMMMVTTMWL